MRRSVGVAIASLALGLVTPGCSFDEVRLRAAHDLECASGKLSMQQIDDSRVRFMGCGRTATYFCGVDSRGFDSCTRERPNPRAEVQKMASNDLLCNLEKIVIDDVDKAFAATGCGRTATYACRETADGHRCEALTAPSPAKPKPPREPPR